MDETKNNPQIPFQEIKLTFKNFIPLPSKEEVEQLEKNILQEGRVRESLILWKKKNSDGTHDIVLVDGYLRYEIISKHSVDYTTVFMEFTSEDEVKIFILSNQLGRRHLSKYWRCRLVLQREDLYKKQGRENMSKGGQGCQILDKEKIDTKKVLSKKADVSHGTLYKVKEIQEKVKDPEILDKLGKGEISITEVHNGLNGKCPIPKVRTNQQGSSDWVTKNLFDHSGIFCPDMSKVKNLSVSFSDDGISRIEVVTKKGEKFYSEISIVPDVTITCPQQPEPVESEKLLGISYEKYDYQNLFNPEWEDFRTLFIKEIRKKYKNLLLKMRKKSVIRVMIEELRLQLVKNFEEKNQPLGGGNKDCKKIINEMKKFWDLDPTTILISDDSGNNDVLVTTCKLTSGTNQYFPEMLSTKNSNGKSVMDVIYDPIEFLKFVESVIIGDRFHAFTKSIEKKKESTKIPYKTIDPEQFLEFMEIYVDKDNQDNSINNKNNLNRAA